MHASGGGGRERREGRPGERETNNTKGVAKPLCRALGISGPAILPLLLKKSLWLLKNPEFTDASRLDLIPS